MLMLWRICRRTTDRGTYMYVGVRAASRANICVEKSLCRLISNIDIVQIHLNSSIGRPLQNALSFTLGKTLPLLRHSLLIVSVLTNVRMPAVANEQLSLMTGGMWKRTSKRTNKRTDAELHECIHSCSFQKQFLEATKAPGRCIGEEPLSWPSGRMRTAPPESNKELNHLLRPPQ